MEDPTATLYNTEENFHNTLFPWANINFLTYYKNTLITPDPTHDEL